jgi:hypothetical protein
MVGARSASVGASSRKGTFMKRMPGTVTGSTTWSPDHLPRLSETTRDPTLPMADAPETR